MRIAQSNNFMGLVCSARLLSLVPALIEAIKVAGLVLVADTSGIGPRRGGNGYEGGGELQEGMDGVLRGDGVLRFEEMIDM